MTNQTQFHSETPKARLQILVVPDDVKDFRIHENKIFMFRKNEFVAFHLDNLPPGDWQLLGTGDLNEVTEEQAASVVQQYTFNKWHNYENNMPFHEFCANSAVEALQSIARSLGIPEDKKTIVLFDLKK